MSIIVMSTAHEIHEAWSTNCSANESCARCEYVQKGCPMLGGRIAALLMILGLLGYLLAVSGGGEGASRVGWYIVGASFPAALLAGIIGIAFDDPKWLAITVTALIPLLVAAYYVLQMMF